MALIIDWSQAPDDATHYEHVKESHRGTFMRWADNTWMYWSPARQEWCLDKYGHMYASTFIPRPKPTPVWNGEGLPPVGTVCEAWVASGWHRGTIIGHCLAPKENYLAFQGASGLIFGASDIFRHLRTPEQIAEEEREKAIQALLAAFDSGIEADPAQNTRSGIEAIYDHGWRRMDER